MAECVWVLLCMSVCVSELFLSFYCIHTRISSSAINTNLAWCIPSHQQRQNEWYQRQQNTRSEKAKRTTRKKEHCAADARNGLNTSTMRQLKLCTTRWMNCKTYASPAIVLCEKRTKTTHKRGPLRLYWLVGTVNGCDCARACAMCIYAGVEQIYK